jgi:hypothetical protein
VSVSIRCWLAYFDRSFLTACLAATVFFFVRDRPVVGGGICALAFVLVVVESLRTKSTWSVQAIVASSLHGSVRIQWSDVESVNRTLYTGSRLSSSAQRCLVIRLVDGTEVLVSSTIHLSSRNDRRLRELFATAGFPDWLADRKELVLPTSKKRRSY